MFWYHFQVTKNTSSINDDGATKQRVVGEAQCGEAPVSPLEEDDASWPGAGLVALIAHSLLATLTPDNAVCVAISPASRRRKLLDMCRIFWHNA